MRDLGQVLLIEEGRIGLPARFEQLADVAAAQAGDPAAALQLRSFSICAEVSMPRSPTSTKRPIPKRLRIAST
jgi:hypothetical protein